MGKKKIFSLSLLTSDVSGRALNEGALGFHSLSECLQAVAGLPGAAVVAVRNGEGQCRGCDFFRLVHRGPRRNP